MSGAKQLKARPAYQDKLQALKDNGLIKVVVGMRRCGKSSLLQLFAQALVEEGVPRDNVVEMNFESAECFSIVDYRDLAKAVQERTEGKGHCYLLFDEIQLVDSWEKAVNSFRVDLDVDICLTGSNAYLLSTQLATLLSGRFVEIPVYPLTFKEFLDFAEMQDADKAFERYITYGGLPPVVEQGENHALAQTVLSGIYSTVFVKDIAQHVQIRNPLVFSDVACFLADTAGSRVSVTNIENRLKSAHRKTSGETIERYMQALLDSFLFYRLRRYDVRGGAFLQGLEKYYPSDLGIRSMLRGFLQSDYGYTIENAVCNELKTRGYEVRVGKADSLEIDFIASEAANTMYVQVSASIIDPETRKRELEPFKAVASKPGRKVLLTTDRLGLGEENGIEIMNVIDWMMA